jgi:uncharacterized membrane protein
LKNGWGKGYGETEVRTRISRHPKATHTRIEEKAETGFAEVFSVTDHRSRSQRWSDAAAEFCGSWGFVFWTVGIMAVWFALNTIWLIFGTFDPYPFILFNLFLTIVSTLQGPIIMMSQNRQVERDREVVKEMRGRMEEINQLIAKETESWTTKN